MKKKMFMLLICLVLVFSFITVGVKGAQNSISQEPYNENLLNYTNTFNGGIVEKTTPIELGSTVKNNYLFPKYNVSSIRNSNAVSKESPKITFITHGLGGSYENWLQKEHFKGSIIDELNQTTICDFYVGKISYDGANILCAWNKILIKNVTIETVKINHIENTSNHIVILFSASEKSKFNVNDFVYSEFNYMASLAIKQIKDYDTNHQLPRVNLIGHSRGGLTNLQFALDHPDLVDSIYSLGTPYLGTTMGNIHRLLSKIDSLSKLFPFSIGEEDIINEYTYNEYYDRWNINYESLYKNINVIALGAYCDFDFLLYSINAKINMYINDHLRLYSYY